MLRKFGAALTAIWLTWAGPAYSQINDPGDAVVTALDYLTSGQVYEAVEGLKEAVREDPTSAAAYFYLSSIYTQTAQYLEAREFLERAMQIHPEEARFHYQLGMIRHREGDRLAALAAFEEAVRLGLGANEGDVWRQIGEVQTQLLDRDEALEAYETAVRIEPQDARNRLALGQFYLDRNETDLALTHLRAAVEIAPTLPEAYATLGLAMRRSGDTATAVDTLRRGLELNPADQKSRYGLALSLVALGRDVEARSEMDEYDRIQRTIERANAAIEMGSQRFEAGDLIEARQLLDEAVGLAPTYSAAHQLLGQVLLGTDDTAGALGSLGQAVAINPLNAEAYFAMGTAYQRTGELEAAMEATRKAIVLDEGDARYHRQLGALLLNMDRDLEGRAALQEALRLESDSGFQE